MSAKPFRLQLGASMLDRLRRIAVLAFLCSTFLFVCASRQTVLAQSTPADPQLKIDGAVSTPLTLTAADLKKMPRTTLHVTNAHEDKSETYEGVLLEELIRRAGVSHGEQLRGKMMAGYVIAEAEDGYKVVFSLAELDSGIANSEVLVADTVDGAPIDAKRGPFRLVAPHDKRPARWVRMLKSITVFASKDSN
jgi:DMSO/TMAO reductase YedYZ molybdopterin-dependent catalytic subunit